MTADATAASSLWSVFTAKAELLGAAVMRAGSADAAGRLLTESAPGFVCTASALARFPGLASYTTQPSESTADVVAAAEFAIVETGSVAINEPQPDRARCFLAEHLWVLVPEQALVTTLDEGLQRIGDLVRGGATHPLLMSGPSRTADIERVLTIGVHGPRSVAILVIAAS